MKRLVMVNRPMHVIKIMSIPISTLHLPPGTDLCDKPMRLDQMSIPITLLLLPEMPEHPHNSKAKITSASDRCSKIERVPV